MLRLVKFLEIYELLSRYSALYPQYLLQVETLALGEEDLLLFYKGQVSSLMRSTPSHGGIPLWDDTTELVTITLLKAPYNPLAPIILIEAMTLQQVQEWVADETES